MVVQKSELHFTTHLSWSILTQFSPTFNDDLQNNISPLFEYYGLFIIIVHIIMISIIILLLL